MKQFELNLFCHNTDIIPVCAKDKYTKIMTDFYAKHKNIEFSQVAIRRAQQILLMPQNIRLTQKETQGFKDYCRLAWCTRLRQQIRAEYTAWCKKSCKQKLHGTIFVAHLQPEYEQAAELAYLINNPEIMQTIQRLSKLRCATRKTLKLTTNEYIGF